MKDMFEALATVAMLVIAAWTLKILLTQQNGHGKCGCKDKAPEAPTPKVARVLGSTPSTVASCGLGPKKSIGGVVGA